MEVTLDAELQKIRRKNLEDLAKFYGGGQIAETEAITALDASYTRPIPTIKRRRR
ncbi:MAG: hypothetical protein GH144_06620 [Clostridia bacterium]|jgi:hypothetical protein|nr:hypothetical protein [Clostridia bacterium]